ncbi:TetR/AcrR family transcriptional regulator [Curtobacterium sp. YR515]|uniref:TetR/AcrR family transcriptional regulator n=1 Tax=Curtobacterium sp. YR515 TaxID=1855316 RepID=UPI0008E99D90|nr:TetR/AcrR family transcriptional regulator [Curtobacterium sp. YR515]SFF94534.1 transcriptional regulator, TetR family [Curtobacterium sp. YR515]
MPSDDRPARLGRPRAVPDTASALSPRDQILDAAAALFVENGFSATSTRAIAERVGIRQASLYYHFAGKDEVLVELLTTSVRPSLDVVRGLEERVPGSVSAAGALAALVLIDIDTLARTPHNIGTLYLLPEVQGERYEGFRTDRQELQDTYGRLGALAATEDVRGTVAPALLGGILIQLAETVIQLRRTGEVDDHDREAFTGTCLRACGLDSDAVAAARREADALLAAAAV